MGCDVCNKTAIYGYINDVKRFCPLHREKDMLNINKNVKMKRVQY